MSLLVFVFQTRDKLQDRYTFLPSRKRWINPGVAPGSVNGKGWLAEPKLSKRQNIEEKARLRPSGYGAAAFARFATIDLSWLAEPKLAKAGGR